MAGRVNHRRRLTERRLRFADPDPLQLSVDGMDDRWSPTGAD
jgi:hypothetical protein